MKLVLCITTLALLTLTGCSGKVAAPTAAVQGDEPMVVTSYNKDTPNNAVMCKSEKKLGSHVSTKVCKTIAQIKEERDNAEKLMMEQGLSPSQKHF